MPPAKGCRLWHEPQTTRVRVGYVFADVGLRTTSWSLKRYSEHDAVLACLQWQWTQHSAAHPDQVCPHSDVKDWKDPTVA